MDLYELLLKFKPFKYYFEGKKLLNNPFYLKTIDLNNREFSKNGSRTDIINFIVSSFKRPVSYLEIGVRNPSDNYEKIKASTKYSVDPGFEYKRNPVDFKMTSDDFFKRLENGQIQSIKNKFDIIFIDGLHLADQVDRDIENSFKFLSQDGFIVLHDCNPPTEWHARETFHYLNSPAGGLWNGTTWKAFIKWRSKKRFFSCCINTDWGVGILSRNPSMGNNIEETMEFYEFTNFDKNREYMLNLMNFKEFKSLF